MTASEPTAVLEPTAEVRRFVTAVRSRLSDLTEEEREELVGGLEADMSDLVAERGVEALPEPVAYAAELRSAAGFSAEGAAARGAVRDRVTAWLDRGSATWNRWVGTRDHLGLPAFATSLRPAWWLLRALCAAALVMEAFGSQGIFGLTFEGFLVTVVFSVISVQIGRGAWWPGTMLRRSLTLRVVMIGLNIFAVAMLPVMFNRFLAPQNTYYDVGPAYANDESGLMFQGQPVGNVYAYDAQGHPLLGVQLVDQVGRRLALSPTLSDDMGGISKVLTPWLNGRTKLYSVFPLPERSADPATGEGVGEARLQTPPFASLPPVTLTGVQPSVLLSPAQVEQQQAKAAQKAAQRAVLAKQKALKAKRNAARSGNGG